MERRFELRLEELLEDAVLDPRIPEGMLDRLERFVKPYAAIMESPAQQQHLWEYVAGLFSDVKRKNAETIAYFHDQNCQALQKFLGQSLWDDGLLIEELSRQVGAELGGSDGVRSLGLPETRQGIGGRSTAVVWPLRQNRQLPGRHLSGLRFAKGARPGGRAAVSQ